MTHRYFDLGIEPPLEPPAYDVPHCPRCGAETDEIATDMLGDAVGCPECIKWRDAWATLAKYLT